MMHVQIKKVPSYDELMGKSKSHLVRLVGRLAAEFIEIRDTATALVESVEPKQSDKVYEDWSELDAMERALGLNKKVENRAAEGIVDV